MGGNNQHSVESFADSFQAVRPLISTEWPAVDDAALAATEGDFDKVVELVSSTTEHTKALVRRQLAELQQIAADAPTSSVDGKFATAQRKLQDMLRNVQAKTHELSEYARSQALADAKAKAEQHPLVTLLMAVGLGFILGFVLRGLGRGQQPRAS